MAWNEWTDAAFEEARERGVPVLLFLRSSWCRFCRELEARTFGAPEVAPVLEGLVCVMVDKDRRPDIDTRYRRSGWPTLAWLDADGEVLAFENFVEPDELVSTHQRVLRGEVRELGPEVESAPETLTSQASAELDRSLVQSVVDSLVETADPEFGGWGRRHKFPHPEALHLLTVSWSEGMDEPSLDVVQRTLRHMQDGQIHDRVEGGFFRYATRADWSGPHHEKMLDSNAQRLLAYIEAYQALGDESHRETAEGILRWLKETMLDEETGAFRGSQDAVAEYYNLSTPEARAQRPTPECDPTIFTNWNAMAVCSLLEAGVVLNEPAHTAQALRTLDFLIEALWDERHGMYHYWDGTYNLPCFLADQAYTLRALVAAMQYTGENRYLSVAKRLALVTIEHLQAEDGSFFDTRYDPKARGSLRQRNSSILENAVMADALLRLSHVCFDSDLADKAREVLKAFLPNYKSYGHFVAGYARVVDLLINPPLHVTIIGPRAAEETRALRNAALAPYVASRIVQTIDPDEDVELFAKSGLPAPRDQVARAYVHRGQESYAETSKLERIAALMLGVERSN